MHVARHQQFVVGKRIVGKAQPVDLLVAHGGVLGIERHGEVAAAAQVLPLQCDATHLRALGQPVQILGQRQAVDLEAGEIDIADGSAQCVKHTLGGGGLLVEGVDVLRVEHGVTPGIGRQIMPLCRRGECHEGSKDGSYRFFHCLKRFGFVA